MTTLLRRARGARPRKHPLRSCRRRTRTTLILQSPIPLRQARGRQTQTLLTRPAHMTLRLLHRTRGAPTDASPSSLSTGRYPPQSPGQTDNHPPPGPPSTGAQQSADGLSSPSAEPQSPSEPEPETFLSNLLKGKIKRRTSGSGTVNAAQRELQDTLDSRAYVPLSSLSYQPSNIPIINVLTLIFYSSTINGFGKSLDVSAPPQ